MRLFPLLISLMMLTPAQAGVYLTFHRPNSSGPSAREQAANQARQRVLQAQVAYRQAYARTLANHPMDFELRQARQSLTRAYRQLSDARAQIITHLRQNPRYRLIEQTLIEQEFALVKEQDPEKRFEQAQQLLRLRAEKSRMETDAISDSIEVSVAQSAVQSARNELLAVEKMYQWHLAQADTLSAARSHLQSARQELVSIGD
ncbi:MAG: hypothetical protein KatS3mg104_0169 [Phycisphaerae bacterium]|nr:MAG: hypothetical protein KatS3mg104_0169 [Phycisphaerae bacterium]